MTETAAPALGLETRLRAIEDRLEILNLIAGHPPGADSASGEYAASYWVEGGSFDRGEGLRGSASHAEMIANLAAPGFQAAVAQGIAHFAGLPHIEIDGDRAIVTSYLQILMPDPTGDAVELSAHGTSKGFRVHRLSANRWDLVRTREGWRIERRVLRSMDSPEARSILRGVAERSLAKGRA
jgi:hypothetical protein